MKYRESILKTLDLLISESSKNTNEKTRDNKLDAWHIGLNDISDEQIFEGMKKAIKSTDGYLMACGTFRELCLIGPNSVSIEDDAEQAWYLVMKILNHTQSPYFKDGVISESIRRMGGWKNLCLMLTKDEPFRKKDFVLNYISIKKSGKIDFDQHLLGTFGADYTMFVGYDMEKEQPLIEQIQSDLENGKRTEKKVLKMLTEKIEQNESKTG